MELALSLGEPPTRRFDKDGRGAGGSQSMGLKLGICMGFGVGGGRRGEAEEEGREGGKLMEMDDRRGSVDPPVQLNLLPPVPVPRQDATQLGFPWTTMNVGNIETSACVLDVNKVPMGEEAEEGMPLSSSPNSAVSSFPMEFNCGMVVAAPPAEVERASSRGSDEEENGAARKKLRLSKEQSAFLEESFKEQNTLNPKQKLALAKQLNLRPRQVEVWFQNRRARTKLKQTEVDCEYLKRCCETLREENRRLQKELTELRALKTTQPFYMQLPATTLSMCPSCERVSSIPTSIGSATTNPAATTVPSGVGQPTSVASDKQPAHFGASLFNKPRFFALAGPQPTSANQSSAAS
ncbi:hypothetical protein HPP92_018751 [Vanilla planifolia]|uniref:Homeobox domain-containing protein n=1 Tax=Vanilla planifolia TaxID=51239 RepID=A0A835UK33_VANPL|nr:hypothetical protein HPP92_018751 [Vanilla planifolia]